MIMINVFENDKNITIEVTGHGDDSDQSCARVSTVLDCIYLVFKYELEKYKKKSGYTILVASKRKMYKKGILFLSYLNYLHTLEELYPKSIKINEEKEVK